MLEEDGKDFNERWGYLSRAGLNDKSQFTRQIEKYAGVTLIMQKSKVSGHGSLPISLCPFWQDKGFTQETSSVKASFCWLMVILKTSCVLVQTSTLRECAISFGTPHTPISGRPPRAWHMTGTSAPALLLLLSTMTGLKAATSPQWMHPEQESSVPQPMQILV